MSTIYFTQYNIDPVSYFIDYFTQHIAEYRLNELTNNASGDIPSINAAHPLALEYGNMLSTDEDNYTSIMPAIGIELISDTPSLIDTLGRRPLVEEVTQVFITQINAISMKDRYKQGIMLSDDNLTAIQTAYTAKAGDPLYSRTKMFLESQSVTISIWANDITIKRLIYIAVKSLLRRIQHDISAVEGVKNMKINGVDSLYNYDFSETLFGAEFNVDFMQRHKSVEVDTDIIKVTDVDEYAKTGILANKDEPGLTGVGKS